MKAMTANKDHVVFGIWNFFFAGFSLISSAMVCFLDSGGAAAGGSGSRRAVSPWRG